MVDSISSIAAPKAIEAVKTSRDDAKQAEAKQESKASSASAIDNTQDKVDISEEAIRRQAQETKTVLEELQEETLGLNPSFDTTV